MSPIRASTPAEHHPLKGLEYALGHNQGTGPGPGCLKGKRYISTCPPDVDSQTRILAICGTQDNDIRPREAVIEPEALHEYEYRKQNPSSSARSRFRNALSKGLGPFSWSRHQQRREFERMRRLPLGLAAPERDGWFYSDFYLFYQLFKGAAPNQIWMCSEDPRQLVEKYGKYLHGDDDRRVVLDEEIAKMVHEDPNFRQMSRKTPKEDFLRVFHDECALAEANRQPLLLLIFGHGSWDTHGVSLGPIDARVGDLTNCLSQDDIQQSLKGMNVPMSLMMTSNYSGGWLYEPDLVVTKPQSEGYAHPTALTSRFHGSFWVDSVTKAFVEMEYRRATQIHPFRNKEDLPDPSESITYYQLEQTIYEVLSQEIDCCNRRHQISFAVQDDIWGHESGRRSGFSLTELAKRWNKLRSVEPQKRLGDPAGEPILRAGTEVTEPRDDLSHISMVKIGLSEPQSLTILQELCGRYSESSPGPENLAKNRAIHAMTRDAGRGRALGESSMRMLTCVLRYRMDSMELANVFRKHLGISFVPCQAYDVEPWQEAELRQQYLEPGQPGYQKYEETKWFKFETCLGHMISKQIFPDPAEYDDYMYLKPLRYLAIVLVENMELQETIECIATLGKVRDAEIQDLVSRIRHNPLVKRHARDHFYSQGKRLPSVSPE